MERQILELLRQSPLSVTDLVRRLGSNYGAVQWHVLVLEKKGLVRTVKVGRRRYVFLPGHSGHWVRVADLLEEVQLRLKRAGVNPQDRLIDVLPVLRQKDPALAEWLEALAP